MPESTGTVRIHETLPAVVWPVQMETVSHIGGACVVQGSGDFDLADLNMVRRRFPGRHVTLDGDVITVWPPAPQDEPTIRLDLRSTRTDETPPAARQPVTRTNA